MRNISRFIGMFTGANAVERAARAQADAVRRAQEEETKRMKELEEQRKREEAYNEQIKKDTEALMNAEQPDASSLGNRGLDEVVTSYTSNTASDIVSPEDEDGDKIRKAIRQFGRR